MDETKLVVKWSKREKDFMVYYPRKCDGALIQYKLFHRRLLFNYMKFMDGDKSPYDEEDDFIKELERRGYDKTTLRFEIKLAPK